jgi:hypothetical protein
MTWILPKQLHTLACALDTAALSLDSNESSRICAQSLFVRSKPLPLRTWSAKWKRDSWTRHLSGRILEPSLGERFVTEWTSLLAVTPASPSAAQESGQARMTRGIYGPTSQMVFDFSDPSSASLKTSKDISAWGCPTSSKTWQEWVTERRGAYSQRLNAVRRINASGCSSWPSPVASEVRHGFQDRSRGMKGSQESLTTVVVKSWPTPSGMDGERPQETQEQWEQRNARKRAENPNLGQLHRPLTVAVTALHGHPVPASSSTDGSRPESWATPQARDHKSGRGNEDREYKELTPMVERTQAGKLNPRWVETLMGLPVGWTMPSCVSPVTIEPMSFDCSATELCQPQPSGPSEC